jgi:hypothetical protein
MVLPWTSREVTAVGSGGQILAIAESADVVSGVGPVASVVS